jgi:hypothetical protein
VSARNCLSAVRTLDIQENIPYTRTRSIQLSYVLHGLENTCPSASFKHPWSPVSRAMLNLLCHHLDIANGLDVAVRACTMAYLYGQVRLGEVLGTLEVDYTHVPLGSDLHPPVSLVFCTCHS